MPFKSLLFVLLLAVSASARPDDARRHFNTGVTFFSRGDLINALAEFEASYRINPVPEVLHNIGLTQKGLGRYREAIETFYRYLDEAATRPSLLPQRKADVEQMIAEMRAKLPPENNLLALPSSHANSLKPTAPKVAAPAPLPAPPVSAPPPPGVQTPLATSPTTVNPPPPSVVEAAPAVTPSRHTRTGFLSTRRGMATLWMGTASAAILLSTAVTGGLSLSIRKEYDAGCMAGSCNNDLYDKGRNYAMASDALLAVGIASAVATTLVALVPLKSKRYAVSPLGVGGAF